MPYQDSRGLGPTMLNRVGQEILREAMLMLRCPRKATLEEQHFWGTVSTKALKASARS